MSTAIDRARELAELHGAPEEWPTCECGDLKVDHHLNRYLGFSGQHGHGKCARDGCPCKSYREIPRRSS